MLVVVKKYVVAVAQLVERRIVIPVVEGSIPFSHPIISVLSGHLALEAKMLCGCGEIGIHARFRFWCREA